MHTFSTAPPGPKSKTTSAGRRATAVTATATISTTSTVERRVNNPRLAHSFCVLPLTYASSHRQAPGRPRRLPSSRRLSLRCKRPAKTARATFFGASSQRRWAMRGAANSVAQSGALCPSSLGSHPRLIVLSSIFRSDNLNKATGEKVRWSKGDAYILIRKCVDVRSRLRLFNFALRTFLCYFHRIVSLNCATEEEIEWSLLQDDHWVRRRPPRLRSHCSLTLSILSSVHLARQHPKEALQQAEERYRRLPESPVPWCVPFRCFLAAFGPTAQSPPQSSFRSSRTSGPRHQRTLASARK